MTNNIVQDILQKHTVFKDESVLDVEYTPDSLMHRGRELGSLALFFRPLLETPGKASPVALIYSRSGTGKTSITKTFGGIAADMLKSKGIDLKYVHINCKFVTNMHALMQQIVRSTTGADVKGLSPDLMFREMYRQLDANNKYLLLTLDEVDWFIKRTGEDLIEQLTRYREELSRPKRLAIIFVIRDSNIDTMAELERSKLHRTFGARMLKLEPYTKEQLVDIIGQRVQMAFRTDGSVPDNIIDFIAEMACSIGDAYYAIQILWKAGKCADNFGMDRVIPEHVRMAKSMTDPKVRSEDLLSLPRDEKVVLQAVANLLRKESNIYVNLSDITETYHVLCETYRSKPADNRSVREYLLDLSRIGFLDIKNAKSKLEASIHDVPIGILLEVLEPMVAKEHSD
ncbi:putative cell division control protein 6 [Candidatus Nitrososphaera gargensis Ga9.2]|uniref:ORC1-type DNA replication protein n=1 Tax=Nitrososphaera gargensis (strain Ga9.2) TaxID=1237085 RepID=K0IKH7_NITGG|nr:AAA family ATPase [Candidatus Nitrososphaera gargensis]AFU58942.1 putative cell division control protein 6 [Candidatus Nitrososphaera gargensis Ga9.2]